jgi:hypothetical protein
MPASVLKAGCLAFLDSFSGLVPVKVIKITETPDPLLAKPRIEVFYEVTETVGGYKKGDKDQSTPHFVVPRGCIHRPAGSFHPRILPYQTEVTRG